MNKRMNIAYATTHGWNVGDDFIRIGCERLVEGIFPDHNRIIYDKSPHVRDFNGNAYERHNGEFHGNSIQVMKHSDYRIDLMVVAGTPENSIGRMLNFFDLNRECPVMALAVGEPIGKMNERFEKSFGRCGLITVRSEELLEGYRVAFGENVHYMPCTSLFWSDRMRRVSEVKKVALGWKCRQGAGLTCNDMPVEDYKRMIGLYRLLVSENRSVEFFIVCHHVDEIGDAEANFPNLEIRYDYDEHKYADIYWDADFVVTPKVHDCGCCASLGIGGAFLPTDFRAGTANGFLSKSTWDKDEILDAIGNAKGISDMIHAHKEESFRAYSELMSEWKGRCFGK